MNKVEDARTQQLKAIPDEKYGGWHEFQHVSEHLQIAVSWASLIFQKIFPHAVSSQYRPCVASTSCTRSNIATTKIIIEKILKTSSPKGNDRSPENK